MAEPIAIQPAAGTWVVRANGAVIAESSAVLELFEPGHDPVIYFPRGDIAMAFWDPSETRTTCPHKGEARHYHLEAKSGRVSDAAWSYEDPLPAVAQIKGYLAFYPDKVTVEKL